MKQDDTKVFLEGWIEHVINWSTNSSNFILRTLTHVRRVRALNWIFTLNLPWWRVTGMTVEGALYISYSLASHPSPLNLILSAVEGGPLLTGLWIDFWFPRGSHTAVMFYGATIQRATEITTLVFWQGGHNIDSLHSAALMRKTSGCPGCLKLSKPCLHLLCAWRRSCIHVIQEAQSLEPPCSKLGKWYDSSSLMCTHWPILDGIASLLFCWRESESQNPNHRQI